MIAVTLDHVNFTYSGRPLLSDLSWRIHNDRTVGLIGINGCGKSTLLKLILGEYKQDAGIIVIAKGARLGYLAQEPPHIPNTTIWQRVSDAAVELHQVERELGKIEASLGEPEVYGVEEHLQAALARQERLLKDYDDLGGPTFESRIQGILKTIGIPQEAWQRDLEHLSGGERKLVELARLLVAQPDVLLLDEPDNHLDIRAKMLLERLIREFSGGVVIVSHDRYLLDLVADEIAELDQGHIDVYVGNYSEYAAEKETRLARQQTMYDVQQRVITRLQQAAKRLIMWGKVYDNPALAKSGKSLLKRIEHMDKVEKPVTTTKPLKLELTGWRGSNKVLELVGLSKAFEAPDGSKNEILDNIDLLLWHGQRVGIVGPNGAGKSVLFRLILGSLEPDSGLIKIGPSIEPGYYAQQHETLDYATTVLDTIRQAAHMAENQAVSFLTGFGFTYEQCANRVSELSGGERSRLQLALLMLSNANLLLLDEPTNNLDIQAAEHLEEALEGFEGTIVVISHDRYFLDRTVDRVVEIDQACLTEYEGGYSDYIEAHGL